MALAWSVQDSPLEFLLGSVMSYFSLVEKPSATPVSSSDDDSPPTLDTHSGPRLNPLDWQELLFGGREKVDILCDVETDQTFRPTYFEDCKLAEDAALNQIAKCDVPIANYLRNVNYNQVTRALGLIRKGVLVKKRFSNEEGVLACMLVLDFLSCSCQDGLFSSLYEKCKDDRKRLHIDTIDTELASAINHLRGYNLDQMHRLERLVTSSVDRIPDSLHIKVYSSKFAVKRKLAALEKEDTSQKENSVFHFSDDLCSPAKKSKPSSSAVISISKKWLQQPIEPQKPDVQTPPANKLLFAKALQSTPLKMDSKGDYVFTPELTGTSASTPKSSGSNFCLDELFQSYDDEPTHNVLNNQPSQVSHQIWTPRKSSSLDKHAFSISPEAVQNDRQGRQITQSAASDYPSDDSLPDIPIDLESYLKVSKKNKTTPKESIAVSSSQNSAFFSDPSDNCREIQGKSVPHPSSQKAVSSVKHTSPYKNKYTTWNSSKYLSPKVGKKSTTSSTAVMNTQGRVMRSPLKAVPNKQNGLLSADNPNKNVAKELTSQQKKQRVVLKSMTKDNQQSFQSSKRVVVKKPTTKPIKYWFQFERCQCGKCKHGQTLAARLSLPAESKAKDAQKEILSKVGSSKVKYTCGKCTV